MTKTLYIDIETRPNLAYVWGKWEQDVIEYKEQWNILCFAYKWAHEKKVHTFALPDFKLYKTDSYNDYHVVRKLWDLLDEADIVVAHNGDEFDVKKINSRFLFHDMKPPSPYKTVDTKKVVKRVAGEMSNSLDDLCKQWGIGSKVNTGGFGLWKGCMAGDMKAWKKMIEYNKNDIVLLEEIYLKLRPWMANHPNVNVLDERTGACPVCASKKLQKRGFSITRVSKKQRYQCQNAACGAWSVGKPVNKINLEIR